MIAPYNLSVVQSSCKPVFRRGIGYRREALDENLAHVCDLMLSNVRANNTRLFVFSEFFLQGFAAGHSVEEWIEASVRLPGPESDELAKVAKEANCFIAGMVYERMDDWPGRFWNTAFIIDPTGEIILKYRKLYAMTAKTRPGDVLDEYVRRYGWDAVHPVVDTEIGRLGALVCYDINFPEVTRSLALNGAEILLHCTGEGRAAAVQDEGGWEMARRARAYENVAYLACANYGMMIDADRPAGHSHGGSEIIDFNGRILNSTNTPDETILTAEIDIESLRQRRASPSLNFLAQLQPHIHLPTYENAEHWPANQWADEPIHDAKENAEVGQRVIQKMVSNGILIEPDSPALVDQAGAEASEVRVDRT